MTKQEYETKRSGLTAEARQLLAEKRPTDAKRKMDEVEALDGEYAAAALEAANAAALENQKPVRMEALSVDVKGTVVEKMNENEVVMFNSESPEYRTAFFNALRGKDLDEAERRAYADVNGMSNTAATAAAAIPTQTMNQIIGRLDKVPTIAAIDVTYIPSNVAFPVEDTVNDAAWVAMGTSATDSADKIKSVSLSAYKLIKTIEITADVEAMSIDAFEAWLVERLANKLAKAVDAAVYTGTGTNQATGIITTISTATGTFTKAAIKYADLMTIIASLGSAYLPNATFAMPRALFYKEVLGMVDTAGNRVVVADAQAPAKFNIIGYPVIVDDNITADNILFGDFKEYKFNFAKAPEVTSDASVGFRTGSTVYRAMALADGKIADENAFVRYTRATT